MGRIMNSWKARPLPACEPPLMMLNEGTGRISLVLPARSAMCLYRGTPFSAAPALQMAMETARMALAPSLPLFSVPSSWIIRSSSSCRAQRARQASYDGWRINAVPGKLAFWLRGFLPITAGAMTLLMLSTALFTDLPTYLSRAKAQRQETNSLSA